MTFDDKIKEILETKGDNRLQYISSTPSNNKCSIVIIDKDGNTINRFNFTGQEKIEVEKFLMIT
ncbi:hypothetical protein CPJCM30710_32730 [Clostridium polyendosporum]|uniref:Uncharacterized protein n=1 Tax=Clostridium polyendosporum TaxID=69208 RepID=A0A919S2L3_9CLOT|nr:hypothetical protein [Clostridium polyendosporum]GIM30607.1 hypothetical protein CPJCM30710_32730 [Clostridium polyendosporum]